MSPRAFLSSPRTVLLMCRLFLLANRITCIGLHTYSSFYFNLSITTTLSLCKVVWRRYLVEVGKLYRTLCLIYPRHCKSISIKSVKYCRSYDQKIGVFMSDSVDRSVTIGSELQKRAGTITTRVQSEGERNANPKRLTARTRRSTSRTELRQR